MAYPILKPSSRSYDPGSYPVKTFKAQNGQETRILYGSERTDVKLSLSYANIGDSNAELFLDHYDEVQGTFQTFNLPGQALGGWDGNDDALKPAEIEIPTVTYLVTVVDSGGNKYRFNGGSSNAQTLELTEGTIICSASRTHQTQATHCVFQPLATALITVERSTRLA